MPEWQERIDGASDPLLKDEHVARYRFAAPLIAAAASWIDLGCGTGVAARAALDTMPGSALLVDVDDEALAAAGDQFGRRVEIARRNLNEPADVEWLDERLRQGPAPACVTAFEVVEHLSPFEPLIRCLAGAAEAGLASVVLSVPNDAFWGIRNPFHETVWSAAAMEELRGLLPAGTWLGAQFDVGGTLILPEAGASPPPVAVASGTGGEVPSQFLAVFGAAAAEPAPVAMVRAADWAERRRWERQREADLAYRERQVAMLEERVRELEAGGAGAT